MARRHRLPKIPGLYQSFHEIKNKYPIGTDLEIINDVRFIKSIERRKNPREVCDPDIAMAMFAKGRDVVNKRTWMVMDKEVLAFDAYYKTTLQGSAGEINCVVRKLKIIYFLVDGTIQVNEAVQQNSGTPQGCFIKRQKIPLPGCDVEKGPHYKATDLTVGETVIFHGKMLKITGVDDFTRDFLNKMGMDVKDDEDIPDDPYFEYRRDTKLDVAQKVKSASYRKHSSRGLDMLILKFRGYWDNRYEMDGQLHFFDVLYYLEDDTIEIIEELEDNSKLHGIAHKPFVKRQRLPMEGPWCLPPGHNNKQEILNVVLNKSNSIYYKMDNRISDEKGNSYYYRTDLYIGATLNVYNRVIVLVSCDEFTKQFYKNVYGLKNFEPLVAPKTMKEIEQDILNQKEVEIILKNYDEIVRKRLIKHGGIGRVFGFLIKMITDVPINKKRDFMLKYYLDDTNVAIYEYRETNSGLRGGMFRSKRESTKNKDGEDLIVFHQLVVGAEITVDEFKFKITDIDDKTLRFMIDNSDEFPHSNLAASLSKAREIIDKRFADLEEFWSKCFHGRELVEREEFRSIVSFDGELDPHVGVVLALTYKRPDPFEPYTELEFRSVVQDTLRKGQFIHFDGLKSNFKARKPISDQNVGYLERGESLKAMKSIKIPLLKEIKMMLIDKYTDTEHGRGVNFEEMVDFMDYIKYPVKLPTGLPRELLFVKPKKVLIRVNEFVDAMRAKT